MEDDLLAEIYLERENEYTLAGSIYKGRVTGCCLESICLLTSAWSAMPPVCFDFMEMEEHDEDFDDIVPAIRGVQDLRAQPGRKGRQAGSGLQERMGPKWRQSRNGSRQIQPNGRAD